MNDEECIIAMQVEHARAIAQTVYRQMAKAQPHKVYLDYLERHVDGIAVGEIKHIWKVTDKRHDYYFRNWLDDTFLDNNNAKKSKSQGTQEQQEIIYNMIDLMFQKRKTERDTVKEMQMNLDRTDAKVQRLTDQVTELTDKLNNRRGSGQSGTSSGRKLSKNDEVHKKDDVRIVQNNPHDDRCSEPSQEKERREKKRVSGADEQRTKISNRKPSQDNATRKKKSDTEKDDGQDEMYEEEFPSLTDTNTKTREKPPSAKAKRDSRTKEDFTSKQNKGPNRNREPNPTQDSNRNSHPRVDHHANQESQQYTDSHQKRHSHGGFQPNRDSQSRQDSHPNRNRDVNSQRRSHPGEVLRGNQNSHANEKSHSNRNSQANRNTHSNQNYDSSSNYEPESYSSRERHPSQDWRPPRSASGRHSTLDEHVSEFEQLNITTRRTNEKFQKDKDNHFQKGKDNERRILITPTGRSNRQTDRRSLPPGLNGLSNSGKTPPDRAVSISSISPGHVQSGADSDNDILEIKTLTKGRQPRRGHKNQISPSKSTKNLVNKMQKNHERLQAGNSVWHPGTNRPEWVRPCFKGFETVVLGDSQLKIFGKQKRTIPGYNITSYSGCDVSAFIL